MSLLCIFLLHRWQHVANINPREGGLWQCARCKELSPGRYVSRLTDEQRLTNVMQAVHQNEDLSHPLPCPRCGCKDDQEFGCPHCGSPGGPQP